MVSLILKLTRNYFVSRVVPVTQYAPPPEETGKRQKQEQIYVTERLNIRDIKRSVISRFIKDGCGDRRLALLTIPFVV